MNCSLKWYFPLLLCILPFVSNGQNGSLMPDVYGQFFQNYYLINPANSDTSSLVLHLGHKSQLGVFRGVRQTYFDANFRIKSKKSNSRHCLGIQLFNNSEGDFFSKNRAYGRYSFDIKLSDSYFLSAGLSVGMVSYAFKATQSSAGGSDLTYDGNIGLWLVGTHFKIGTSMQQVFQGKLSPIGQTFELTRQYNLNASYAFFINPNIQLTTHAWYKHQQKTTNDLQVAAIITMQKLVE
ncbi:type IX secretion system membrane protein PorP/SprF, partial [uncultured Cytophaga sp.]|uniref:type IX secretion system membrane protein PorP/SprF n=1 Tax=uncultured Cytophaga sp. TaxID=160238 RepID=UPI00262003C5